MKTVTVKFKLLATEQGGRVYPITSKTFGCPLFFDNTPELSSHGYDVRFLLEEHGKAIAPGEEVSNIDLVFLSEDEVIQHLKPGAKFRLWEGKTIGNGEVLRI